MPNNWDKFKGETTPDLPQIEFGGSFLCQICNKEVEEATYFYTDAVLKWKCEDGHVSFAENFHIG